MVPSHLWISTVILGLGLGVLLGTTDVSVPVVYGALAVLGIGFVIAHDRWDEQHRP